MITSEVLTALDINERSTVMVSVEKSGKSLSMTAADIQLYPEDSVKFTGCNYAEAMPSITASIKSMLKRSKFKSKSCITYIPSDEAVVKLITREFPDLRDDSIEQFIIMNAVQYIPYDIEAVNFDFVKIGQEDKKQKVLLVACKKDITEDISACVENVGMNLKYAELTQFALLRLLKNSLPERYMSTNLKFMFYIDYDVTMAYAFRGDEPLYSREHNFGYSKLYSMISSKYDISAEEAEKIDVYGRLAEDYPILLKSFIDNIALECFRSYDFFHGSLPELKDVVDMFIFGPGAKLSGLEDDLLSRIKDVSGVYLVDPLVNIDIRKSVSSDFINNNKYALTRSIAMALRGLVHD